MQTHKFKGELFDVEYSSVKIGETGERLRMDSDFYDFIYLSRIEKVKTKNFDTLGNNLSILTDYHANGSYLILNQSVEIKSEKDYALMIRTTDLENNNFETDVKYVSESAYNFLAKTKVYGGEIIINKIGSAGKVYLMPELNRAVSLGMNAFLLRTNENLLEKYLYIYLHTHFGEKIIQQKINGAVPLSIDKASVRDIVVPIPSKPFQERIQELVIESYKQKELSEKLYKEAENLLLSELDLLDYKTKTKNINLAQNSILEVPENHSTTNYNILKELDRFDAEYWDYSYFEIIDKIKKYKGGFDKLTNLVKVSKKKITLDGEQVYNYIELADINKSNGMVENTTEILGKDLPSRARMEIKKGYVLFSSLDGSIDKVAIVDSDLENLVASTGFFIFKENILNKETLLVLLKIFGQKYISREALGTIMSAISNTGIERILLPKIENNIQKIITKKIQESFEAKTKSKNLLEVAKKAVEIYIEEDESAGFEFIENNVIIDCEDYIKRK